MSPSARGTSLAPVNFEAEAGVVLHALQRALAKVLGHLDRVDRAVDLRNRLELDAALAWQVHSLAHEPDPLRVGRIVPKPGAMDRFFESVVRLVPAPSLDEARSAYATFQSLVSDQAGERAAFDAMLAALRPPEASTLARLRRTAFRTNSAIWGVAVRCAVNVVIFGQSSDGTHDCLRVRGRVGVRGLAPGAKFPIHASSRSWGGSDPPVHSVQKRTITGCTLIEDACSKPIPRLLQMTAADGTLRDYVELDGVGRSSEATVFWSSLSHNMPGGSTLPPHGCSMPIQEPAELLLMHMLVPRGWTDPARAHVRVTAMQGDLPPSGVTDRDGPAIGSLPFEGAAAYRGTHLDAMYAPEVPNLPAMVARELAKVPWGNTLFDIYHCAVRYPVLHSMVHLFADGPARDEGRG